MGIFGLFGRKSGVPDLSRCRDNLCIVDLSSIAESSGGRKNSHIRPRENFLALKSVAEFADGEGLKTIVVITGRELKEVKNGKEFKGATVYYVENTQNAVDKMGDLMRSNSSENTVAITSNEDIERQADSCGVSVMRAATLKKAFGGGGDRSRRNSSGSRRGGSSSQRVRGNRKSNRNHKSPRQDKDKDQDKDSGDSSVDDPGVLQLIDPV